MNDALLRRLGVGLAVGGAAIAGYLTYVHYAHASPLCTTGGCEIVQDSRYAELLGLPVAALGLACYLVIAAAILVDTEAARVAASALTLAGAVFSAYLLYVQLVIIDAVCLWCVASDAVFGLLLALTVVRARRTTYGTSAARSVGTPMEREVAPVRIGKTKGEKHAPASNKRQG